jgi:hypothetical protein
VCARSIQPAIHPRPQVHLYSFTHIFIYSYSFTHTLILLYSYSYKLILLYIYIFIHIRRYMVWDSDVRRAALANKRMGEMMRKIVNLHKNNKENGSKHTILDHVVGHKYKSGGESRVILYTIHSILYTTHYTLHTTHYTLYTIYLPLAHTHTNQRRSGCAIWGS